MGRRSHLPLSLYTSSPFIQLQTKNRRHPPDASCKNHRVMTSYGGITRIRLKGRSSSTSSQPAAQAPLYLFVGHIIHRWPILCNGSSAQNQMLILVNMPEPGIPGEGNRFLWGICRLEDTDHICYIMNNNCPSKKERKGEISRWRTHCIG